MGKKMISVILCICMFVAGGTVKECHAGSLQTDDLEQKTLNINTFNHDAQRESKTGKIWSPVFDEEMKKSFDWFLDHVNSDPDSKGYGLVADDHINQWNKASSTGVGFALTAYGIGVENGWITREKAEEITIGTLKTLLYHVANEHGWFYHFLEMNTGKRFENSEVSGIDQFITISGVIFAGEYFGGEAKELADEIYKRVEWDWFFAESVPGIGIQNIFRMGYTPENGFEGSCISYAENMGMYFLGAGSPTHPTTGEAFYTFLRHTNTYEGYDSYISCPIWNQLFTYQYSHAWYDFRNKTDREGVDWYYNSVLATLVNRQFSINNQSWSDTFNENAWGLTPCDGPYGYRVYGASLNKQNKLDGTIAPCGAAGSAPFAANHVKNALEYYRTFPDLWNEDYGFYDSYNLDYSNGWYSKNMYNIDKGITLIMLENLKSGLVWEYMNQNEYVQAGMKRCGITDAESYMIDDADGNQNCTGFQGNIQLSDHASEGSNGYEITSAGTTTIETEVQIKDYTRDGTFTYVSPNSELMERFIMDVKGKCNLSIAFFDKNGNMITQAESQCMENDKYETLIFDLKEEADDLVNVKNIKITITNQGESSVYIDEIRFSTATDMIRYAVIDERPYVGCEVGVEIGFYSPGNNEEPQYQYQWYADGEIIDGATESDYTVTKEDIGKTLRVKVTPVDGSGQPTGKSCISSETSPVTESVPVEENVQDDSENISVEEKLASNYEDSIDADVLNLMGSAQTAGEEQYEKWQESISGIYDVNYVDDVMQVQYDKKGNDWPGLYRKINASDISKYQRLDFAIKGTSRVNIILESREFKTIEIRDVDMDASGTVYSWDLSEHKDILDNIWRVYLYVAPGSNSESGNFEITKFEFCTEKASGSHIIKTGGNNRTTYYDGQSEKLYINQHWFSNDSGVYSFETGENGEWNVSYNKPGSIPYSYMGAAVLGDFSKALNLSVTIQGTAGNKMTLMAYGTDDTGEPWQEEMVYTLSGDRDICKLHLTGVSEEKRKNLNCIMLYADPGVQVDTIGNFIIYDAYLQMNVPEETTPETDMTTEETTEWIETTQGQEETTKKLVETTGKAANPTKATEVSVKKPARVKITKIYAKKKSSSKIKIYIKKINKVQGYEVRISLRKKAKKVLVKKFVKKIRFTIQSKKLRNKKKLYVKVRAYRIGNRGRKIYGKWSKVKRVKYR